MEVDSMHAAIESARRNVQIYVPSEWLIVLRMARRRPKPYIVREVTRNDIKDLHKLAGFFKIGYKCNSGLPVSWHKIKCIRFRRSQTTEIEVKEEYDEEYRAVPIIKGRRTRKRSSEGDALNIEPSMLAEAYLSALPVSKAKKDDLLKLCTSGAIPSHYHTFYDNLIWIPLHFVRGFLNPTVRSQIVKANFHCYVD